MADEERPHRRLPGARGYAGAAAGIYLESLDQILDPSASNLSQFRDRHARGQTTADVSARSGLLIPEFHATDVQAFLRDPHGFDLTESGNASALPNWAMRPASGPINAGTWGMRSYYANAPLSIPVDLNDTGPVLRTSCEQGRMSSRPTAPGGSTRRGSTIWSRTWPTRRPGGCAASRCPRMRSAGTKASAAAA